MPDPRLQPPDQHILRTPFSILKLEEKRRKVTGLIAELSSWEVTLKVITGWQAASFLADEKPVGWIWGHELDRDEPPPEITTVFKGTAAQFKVFAPMFATWVDAQGSAR